MTSPPWLDVSRPVRMFFIGIALFIVGGFLVGTSFIVQALGSLMSSVPAFGGLVLAVLGLVFALGGAD